MAHRTRDQPWYASLNIDLILLVLQNSIFHPYVASLIPLCLRAADIPYSAPAFRNTVIYACLISLLWILQPLNERLAYGRPRKYNPSSEIVVITGGARGLGRTLASIYALKGVPVAVFDISVPRDPVEGVEYYACDVSEPAAVTRVWKTVTRDLGTPTVLINNAGISGQGALLGTSMGGQSVPVEDAVDAIFRTNTTSHFHLARLFLKPLVEEGKPGTLVTVSSVLGRLGAANLSAYTASKAALLAFHATAAAELRPHEHIKTVLVAPGQLSTDMFRDVRQSAVQRFFGPVVEVQRLAMAIVQMVEQGRGGVIAEPAYARWIAVLDLMPVGVARVLKDLAGVDTAMAPQ